MMRGRTGARSLRLSVAVGALAAFLAVAGLLTLRAAAAELRLRVVEAESGATTAYVDPETGRYVIAPPTGHVEAEYGQQRLQARRAEYDPEAGTLQLSGAVRLEDPGVKARAERVDADLRAERYRLEGQVWIERSRADGPADVLTAAQVTYRPGAGEALAQGNVRVEEGPRWFQAATARLWDGLGWLELTGQVTGDWGEWAVNQADRVQVELESGRVTLYGPAEILFQVAEPEPPQPVPPGP
ncbi:hypothetical protein [Limnochorda pilosa]|uniref:Organic solvent tolerance-like N-terminal domain-containing protein n=1 Tax=Limnochorda pilosa TaxID=1555112 RepID=A0A0K2SGL1_LIMPI|nr:hypothetical protein [Limnochorda pilosa]BAS25984.1 hypothetical protein LIP_0127 [Limnochorda pilosa]